MLARCPGICLLKLGLGWCCGLAGCAAARPTVGASDETMQQDGGALSVCRALPDRCSGGCARCDVAGPGVRAWPTATDATGGRINEYPGCLTGGKLVPSVGGDAATWFAYGECGTFKEYSVGEGCAIALVATTDCCDACALRHIDYDIQELVDGTWVTRRTVVGPGDGSCERHVEVYRPAQERVRISARGGFYLCVYQQ